MEPRHSDGTLKTREVQVRDELHEAFYEWNLFVEDLWNDNEALKISVGRAFKAFTRHIDRLYEMGNTAINDNLTNWMSIVERTTGLIREITESNRAKAESFKKKPSKTK